MKQCNVATALTALLSTHALLASAVVPCYFDKKSALTFEDATFPANSHIPGGYASLAWKHFKLAYAPNSSHPSAHQGYLAPASGTRYARLGPPRLGGAIAFHGASYDGDANKCSAEGAFGPDYGLNYTIASLSFGCAGQIDAATGGGVQPKDCSVQVVCHGAQRRHGCALDFNQPFPGAPGPVQMTRVDLRQACGDDFRQCDRYAFSAGITSERRDFRLGERFVTHPYLFLDDVRIDQNFRYTYPPK